MSWLRVDDGFAQHPKFAGWSKADKWDLLALLTYCARFDTNGRVPDDPKLVGVSQRLLDLAERSGWLDRDDDGLAVHDWNDYNPSGKTSAERTRRWRQRAVTRDDPETSPRRLKKRPSRTRDPVPSPRTPKAVEVDGTNGLDFSGVLKDVPA